MGDMMDAGLVFLAGFISGVFAWATVGEWFIRSLARWMS